MNPIYLCGLHLSACETQGTIALAVHRGLVNIVYVIFFQLNMFFDILGYIGLNKYVSRGFLEVTCANQVL